MKNHGEIKPPTPPPAKQKPRIPHSLRLGVIESQSGYMNHARSIERYGSWEVEAITEFEYMGTVLKPGDRGKIPGNIAVFAAQAGDIRFVDSRLEEEERAAAEAARLNIPLPAKDNPAFNFATRK